MKQRKTEKPIRVIPGKNRKHKTELRYFNRENCEHFCVQPGCRFKGQHAQQGVCCDTKPFAVGPDWKYLDRMDRWAKESLEDERRIYGKNKVAWVRYLEAARVGDWMNTAYTLDECVRLRAEVAILKDKIRRQEARKP